ncbi:hypothetical protein NQD34_015640, partial [Periophthalmus magnuspinnatus]
YSCNSELKADTVTLNTLSVSQQAFEHGSHGLFHNGMRCYSERGFATVFTKLVVCHNSVFTIIGLIQVMDHQLIKTFITNESVLAVIVTWFDPLTILQPCYMRFRMYSNCDTKANIFTNKGSAV